MLDSSFHYFGKQGTFPHLLSQEGGGGGGCEEVGGRREAGGELGLVTEDDGAGGETHLEGEMIFTG